MAREEREGVAREEREGVEREERVRGSSESLE
jgi:hypothetical protein